MPMTTSPAPGKYETAAPAMTAGPPAPVLPDSPGPISWGIFTVVNGTAPVVAPMTRPAGPSETGVPLIVAAEPGRSVCVPITTSPTPGIYETVAPATTTGAAVIAGAAGAAAGVNVIPPRTSGLGGGAPGVWTGKAAVRVPTCRIPAERRMVWAAMVVGGPLTGERVVGGRVKGVLGVRGVLEKRRAGVGVGTGGEGKGRMVGVASGATGKWGCFAGEAGALLGFCTGGTPLFRLCTGAGV